MKTVEVFTLKMDYPNGLAEKAVQDEMFKRFVYNTEEYEFIQKNSISIRMVRIIIYDSYQVRYSIEADMDEKIETFWRLKFK
jgi:hypothetical protein